MRTPKQSWRPTGKSVADPVWSFLPASTSFFLQIKQAVPSVYERFVGHDFYVRQRRDGKVVPKGRDHHRPVGEVRGHMRASAGPHTRAAVTPPRWNYYLGASGKVEQAFAGFASGLCRPE
jgi:hypothetical protein